MMMGVEMFLAALMISLMRGTPSVMFIAATPAKWNVFSVICVPGSPMDCAPKAPTVDPAIMQLPLSDDRRRHSSRCASCVCTPNQGRTPVSRLTATWQH